MKKITTIILLLVTCLISNAKNPKPIIKSENYVKFATNLYVSIYETTNKEYNEFLKDIYTLIDGQEYEKLKPDSSMWTKSFSYSYNSPFEETYHKHPAYNKYPAVNLTKESMEKYCEWLTTKYNAESSKLFKKVKFRLPTEKEWVIFACPLLGNPIPWEGNLPYTLDKKGKIIPLANLMIFDYSTNKYNLDFDHAPYSTEVGNYKPNSLGLFDVIGNVAECTSDDKLKGGCWTNTLEESYVNRTQFINLPNPRAGFRIVMEVIE